ncbi:MAG: hypothetical protein BGP10_17440 [Rhodanobacter sp. 68-29]|nr:hypothetical protein [Rhodanobacter sp.]ODU73532.1 MAG: hypothetical protein ABT17_11950 [Rhodanobacter sp. SCN 69-32]OJY55990.1 MAG: hypothetical protein BGP10_17440 [Rhodanobacter sp. 68-29]
MLDRKQSTDETIHFYIHPEFWPRGELPLSPDSHWPGFGFGVYTWTIQTFLRLREAGIACRLAPELPERGVVVAHRECLSAIDGKYSGRVTATKGRFVVDMCADLRPYTRANLHIVQNPHMTRFGPTFLYMRHWPQPGLLPRSAARGETFRTVAYFGNEKNLADDLRSPQWERELDRRGLAWISRYQPFDYADPATYAPASVWSDYRGIDAVVALRRSPHGVESMHGQKPASKLYNAWIAGVPAILGRESAYRVERRSELDYLEANSGDEVLACLDRLRASPELRHAMAENAHGRAAEVCAGATLEAWVALLFGRVLPAYRAWTHAGTLARHWALSRQQVGYQTTRVRQAVERRLGR